jgi:hypothetical protein
MKIYEIKQKSFIKYIILQFIYNFQCFHFCNIYTYISMNSCDTYMPPFEQEKMNEKE